MEDVNAVTPVTRPKRKLLYLPSHAATGFFDYCEEMGRQWEGLLNSLERWGWTPANRIAPTFNLGAEPKTGARIAIPVVRK